MAGDSNEPLAPQSPDNGSYQPVNPFIRYFNHCLAGITESRRIAVRINPVTMDV
ncbi:hypothetical protein H4S02_002341, partial [Coemansia sp. RSA 2611]